MTCDSAQAAVAAGQRQVGLAHEALNRGRHHEARVRLRMAQVQLTTALIALENLDIQNHLDRAAAAYVERHGDESDGPVDRLEDAGAEEDHPY